MFLRDGKSDILHFSAVYLHGRREVFVHTPEKFLAPLTGDVVREQQRSEDNPEDRGECQVVHICVPIEAQVDGTQHILLIRLTLHLVASLLLHSSVREHAARTIQPQFQTRYSLRGEGWL